MVYLDYSATTPVLPEVLDSYNKVTEEYFGNPNSLHSLGVKAHELLESANKQVSELLNIKEDEFFYTSGATESNNLAIIGAALTIKDMEIEYMFQQWNIQVFMEYVNI